MKFVCDGCGKSIDGDARNGNFYVTASFSPRWSSTATRAMTRDACSDRCAAKVLVDFAAKSVGKAFAVAGVEMPDGEPPRIRRDDLILVVAAAFDSGNEGADEEACGRLLDALGLDLDALDKAADALREGRG